MFDRSLIWYTPTVLESSTKVFSRAMAHPPLLNVFSKDAKSLRLSLSALIYSSMTVLILAAFSILVKLNLGVLNRSEEVRERRASGKTVFVKILDII